MLFASRVRGQGDLGRDYGWGLGPVVGSARRAPPSDWPASTSSSRCCICRSSTSTGIFSHQLSQPARNDSGAAHSVASVAVLVLFLAVGAPIVEELFFRGLLLRSLLGRTPPPWPS